MPPSTYYSVLPFFRAPDGRLVAGALQNASNAALAQARAAVIPGQEVTIPNPQVGQPPVLVTYVGAIAFSRSGDLHAGGFEDAEILSWFGETPDDIEEMD